MTNYSQKDWRWRWNKLGRSTVYTIGSSGCLLTCYSAIAGIQPNELNQRLKNIVSGFVNVCEINHTKIYEATYKRIKFIYRHTPYKNGAVLLEIKKNGFCIVKLSNGSIPQHWVVFLGGGKMLDPIDGKVVLTSRYGNSYVAWLELKI